MILIQVGKLLELTNKVDELSRIQSEKRVLGVKIELKNKHNVIIAMFFPVTWKW